MAEGSYLGDFRRGPAVFAVFVIDKGARFRVDRNDGAGPEEVCTFSAGTAPKWHGAWNRDVWCAWIEDEARRIAQHS